MRPVPKELKYVLCGVALGAYLGVMATGITCWLLGRVGRPDFYIRPGAELVHLMILVISGSLFGLLFGALVAVISRTLGKDVPILYLFVLTLLLALPVFGVYDYLVIKHGRLVCPPLPQIVVFIGGLAIAALLAWRSRAGAE